MWGSFRLAPIITIYRVHCTRIIPLEICTLNCLLIALFSLYSLASRPATTFLQLHIVFELIVEATFQIMHTQIFADARACMTSLHSNDVWVLKSASISTPQLLPYNCTFNPGTLCSLIEKVYIVAPSTVVCFNSACVCMHVCLWVGGARGAFFVCTCTCIYASIPYPLKSFKSREIFQVSCYIIVYLHE